MATNRLTAKVGAARVFLGQGTGQLEVIPQTRPYDLLQYNLSVKKRTFGRLNEPDPAQSVQHM